MGSRQKRKSIAEHVLNVTKEYGFCEIFLTLSVDSDVLPNCELSRLLQMHEFKSTYFVPCYFEGFGRVLIQSASHFKECGLFLKTVNVLKSYFEDESNFHKLNTTLVSRIPHSKNNK